MYIIYEQSVKKFSDYYNAIDNTLKGTVFWSGSEFTYQWSDTSGCSTLTGSDITIDKTTFDGTKTFTGTISLNSNTIYKVKNGIYTISPWNPITIEWKSCISLIGESSDGVIFTNIPETVNGTTFTGAMSVVPNYNSTTNNYWILWHFLIKDSSKISIKNIQIDGWLNRNVSFADFSTQGNWFNLGIPNNYNYNKIQYWIFLNNSTNIGIENIKAHSLHWNWIHLMLNSEWNVNNIYHYNNWYFYNGTVNLFW